MYNLRFIKHGCYFVQKQLFSENAAISSKTCGEFFIVKPYTCRIEKTNHHTEVVVHQSSNSKLQTTATHKTEGVHMFQLTRHCRDRSRSRSLDRHAMSKAK